MRNDTQHRAHDARLARPLAPASDVGTPVPSGGSPPQPYAARSSVSTPIADAHIYRPGSALALSILMLPVVLTLGLAALALQLGRAVPLWLPVLALLWLPAVPLLWLAMQSARTTAKGVAVGRPWRTWMEMNWDEIEHVDQRGIVLRITGRSATGETLVIAPRLLHDGARLRREVLMRLPPQVLSVRLSREAAELVHAGHITISPEGAIEGTVEAHTRARFWAAPLVAALALLAGAALALAAGAAAAPTATVTVTAAVIAGGLLALVCLALAAWLPQRITLNAEGVTIVHLLLPARRRTFAWQPMDMVEYTPHLALLRIRDKRTRATCAGPLLFNSEQSAIVWSFVQSHCREHGVLLIKRRRLP